MNVQIPEAFRFLFVDKADDGLPVRYRAGHGGRGSAKSHSFCSAAVIKGAQRPMRVGVFREIQKSIRDSAKRLLDDKIKAHGLQGFYQSTDTEIRGINGTLFMFGGLRTNPDAVKSTEGLDLAIIMEANRVSKRSLNLLIPTVRNDGSEIWAEWNPDEPDDPIDEMFRGANGPPPGSIVRQINWQDNPFFPNVLRAELEYDRRRDPDKYEHVWAGGYQRNSEKRVFRNWRVEEFETPEEAIFRFGADWGFSVDPSVLVRCFIGSWEDGKAVADPGGRTLFIDYEAYEVGCEIDHTPALFAGDCPRKFYRDGKPLWSNPRGHKGIPKALDWQITADSARPETVSYMRRHYFKIVPAIKGPGSLEDGVEFLKSYDIVVHTRCKHTADEFRAYSYKTDPLTDEVLPVLADKDNNVIDAVRYALELLRRIGRPRPPPVTRAEPRDYRSKRDEGGSGMAV